MFVVGWWVVVGCLFGLGGNVCCYFDCVDDVSLLLFGCDGISFVLVVVVFYLLTLFDCCECC